MYTRAGGFNWNRLRFFNAIFKVGEIWKTLVVVLFCDCITLHRVSDLLLLVLLWWYLAQYVLIFPNFCFWFVSRNTNLLMQNKVSNSKDRWMVSRDIQEHQRVKGTNKIRLIDRFRHLFIYIGNLLWKQHFFSCGTSHLNLQKFW